jgi:cobyrinic acid a,c-diamide synthase
MLSDEQVVAAFHRACAGADLAIVEGVMGLFDGSDYDGERASAAQIAKLLGAPVLLVLDIAGAARSAAATALGFTQFDPALHIGGVVLNRAGSESHARGCSGPIMHATSRPVLGWLQKQDALRASERHLGLVPAGESLAEFHRLGLLADTIERQFDLEAILKLATRSAGCQPAPHSANPQSPISAPVPLPVSSSEARAPRSEFSSPVLAVARDEAFCFYYPDNLDLLADAGAQIAFFSPVRGEAPPPEAAGVYLGGGYPELHAEALSGNTAFRDALHALYRRGAPIFAECGGFMALTEALVDATGTRWPMAGLVPGTARMTDKLAALGYRHATSLADNLLVPAGTTLRGHEFHYSVWDAPDAALAHAAWRLRGARADSPEQYAGYADGSLLASYLHLPFAQNPALAERLVARLRPLPSKR